MSKAYCPNIMGSHTRVLNVRRDPGMCACLNDTGPFILLTCPEHQRCPRPEGHQGKVPSPARRHFHLCLGFQLGQMLKIIPLLISILGTSSGPQVFTGHFSSSCRPSAEFHRLLGGPALPGTHRPGSGGQGWPGTAHQPAPALRLPQGLE